MFLVNIVCSAFFYLFLPFYFIERFLHKKSGGWKEHFGFVPKFDEKTIVIHGCSVGEVLAIENLVKRLKNEFSSKKFVITTSTVTGQAVAKKKYGNIVDCVTYFPFDTILSVNRFFDNINPEMIFMLETEIWPCFTLQCEKRNIPVVIISGRISDKSINSYKFFKFFFKRIFEKYSGIYTQSEEDSKRFEAIGADRSKIKFMGNLKFGIKKNEHIIDIGQNGYRVVIAGSTHGKENNFIIEAYTKATKICDNLKLILAPRHFEDIDNIVNYCLKKQLSIGYRSEGATFNQKIDVIILDTLGELSKLYSVCDIAFIGGSLVKVGGHNPLEAVIYNKPVISGNYIFNFRDIYSILIEYNIANIVKNQYELTQKLIQLLQTNNLCEQMENACKAVFQKQSGAEDFVVNVLRETLHL